MNAELDHFLAPYSDDVQDLARRARQVTIQQPGDLASPELAALLEVAAAMGRS